MSAKLEIDRIERILLSATAVTRQEGARVFLDGFKLTDGQMRAIENARRELP